jgi:hypothetical protein
MLILLPCVILAPLRWAVLAWLIMGNLDATGPGFSASDSVGWLNAAKSIALPLFLWWRLRASPRSPMTTVPARLWICLTLYAALSGLWSPFPLGAAKLVGNMVGTFLTFVVLEKAARRGLLNSSFIVLLILGSLALGILQTAYFGTYGYDGIGRPARFSSFLSPQQYAAFLVAFLAVVIWHRKFSTATRLALGIAVGAALAYNGSRTWFSGAVLIVLFYLWSSSKRILAGTLICASTIALGSLLLINLTPNVQGRYDNASSRILATITALATGEDTEGEIGLANLNFRLSIYGGAMNELQSATVSELVFGHGTSSGGDVIMRVFPRDYTPDRLDANRVIHNEWLRALYEWGIIGLALLFTVMGSLFLGLLRLHKSGISGVASAAGLSFLPAFVLALSTENIIAGAGNAVTMSFALLIALTWASDSREVVRRSWPVYASCPTH